MQNTETPNPQSNVPQNFQTGSLYVGDLDLNVTEPMLFEVFRKIGQVTSIRVCRDSSTRRSLGYAYVNYLRVEDAERALDTLNFTTITGGRSCRIMWSQRDPSLRKSGQGNIYIKDLAPNIESRDLYDTFSQFGHILSCKVETEIDGNELKSKGFGYVHFESIEAAKKAISSVDGIELEGKKVHVFEFQTKKQRGYNPNQPKFTNIFIKNLNPKVTEKELNEKYSEFGKITSLVVMQDKRLGKGFAFINFETPESAQKAVENTHDTEFQNFKLYVAKAQKRTERLNELRKQFEQRKLKFQDSNLYIKNLDDQIDDQKLHEMFSQYGKIISSKVMKDENNLSKGFGFVCFSTPEEAQKAYNENGRMHFSKPLYVALAQRKEIRTAQLQAQYAHKQLTKNIPSIPYNNNFNQYNMQRNQFPRRNYNKQNNQPQNNKNYHQKKINHRNNNNNNVIINIEQNTFGNFSNLKNSLDQEQNEDNRKKIIGDFLYSKIDNHFKNDPSSTFDDPGKITGMLLESLDEHELLNLAEDPKELVKKIEEAISVLNEHFNENQN